MGYFDANAMQMWRSPWSHQSLHSRFCFVEASDSGAVGRAGRAKTFHLRKWFECENKRGSIDAHHAHHASFLRLGNANRAAWIPEIPSVPSAQSSGQARPEPPTSPRAEMHKKVQPCATFFLWYQSWPQTVEQFEKAFQDISSKASCRFLNLHILKHILSYCQEHVAAFSSKAIKCAEVSGLRLKDALVT